MKASSAKIITVLTILTSSLVFTGCGESSSSSSKKKPPSPSNAYQTCVEQLTKEGAEKNPSIPAKFNKQLAEAACKIIKTQCGKDPDGAVCLALVKKYSD